MTLLIILAAIALVFGPAAFAIGRSIELPLWLRLTVALPLGAIALLCFGVFSLISIKNYTLPSQAAVIAQLRACSLLQDRTAIADELRKRHFAPVIVEAPFQDPTSLLGIPLALAATSTSYLSLESDPVRAAAGGPFPAALKAVFLFDSHQRLITWSYWFYSFD